MTDGVARNPAEVAAEEALSEIYSCVDQGKSFVLEAGAGAGKTHSLVMALRRIILTQGRELIRKNQRVACITYTNVAKDEIISRTDGHPAVLSETIHAFCWAALRDFQPKLRAEIPNLGGKWPERIREQGEITNQIIKYDLGYPKIEETEVWLHHNDVLTLMVKLLDESKFRTLLAKRFPILFIDEYQDTDDGVAGALKRHFVETGNGPLIGFFGDHWQKIYGTGCGKIQHANLKAIDKKANFRSDRVIIECLNRFRHELPQNIRDPNSGGSVTVFHTNSWQGTRRTGQHWDGDLPPDIAHGYLESVRAQLHGDGWDFSPEKTKVLMLTHNVLASEQGYKTLTEVFEWADSYIKKEDDYIAFFADAIEPVCTAFEQRKFGEMFSALSGRKIAVRKHSDKAKWTDEMTELLRLRSNGSIGEVISHLQTTRLPRLTDKLERKELRFAELRAKAADQQTEDERKFFEQIAKLKTVPYKEVTALCKFIEDRTPFATKHGVKGAEFENVLVVFGRGWNQYNFGQFLDWAGSAVPSGKEGAYERNRNLFYVACSRPKNRLALLFTQRLSDKALRTLSNWFGQQSILALPPN